MPSAMRILLIISFSIGMPHAFAEAQGQCSETFQLSRKKRMFHEIKWSAEIEEQLHHHAVWKLRKTLDYGKGLHFLSNRRLDGELSENHLGEDMQNRFAAQLIKRIFPKALLTSRVGFTIKDYDSIRSKNPIYLDIYDVEETSSKQLLGPALHMSLLKMGNPTSYLRVQSEARRQLAIPEGAQIFSLYAVAAADSVRRIDSALWDVPSAIEPLALEESNLKKQLPNIAQLLEALPVKPDILFVSEGGRAIDRISVAIPAPYQTTLISDFLKNGYNSYGTNPKLVIINDSVGQLSLLHASADLAIISGPINFAEALNAGTPTIVFFSEKVMGGFTPTVYRDMILTGLPSGGLFPIADTTELKQAVSKALQVAREQIVPTAGIKFQSLPSPFEKVLDMIIAIVENHSSAKY